MHAEAQRPRSGRPGQGAAAGAHDLGGSGADDDIDPALMFDPRHGGDADDGDFLPEGSASLARKRKQSGAHSQARGGGAGGSKRARNKPEMTIEPDGTVRQGGLEGRKRPGRPRKSVTNGHSGAGSGGDGDESVQQDVHGMPGGDAFEPMHELRGDAGEHGRGVAPPVNDAHLVDLLVATQNSYRDQDALGGPGGDDLDMEHAIAGSYSKYDAADVDPATTLAEMSRYPHGRPEPSASDAYA